MEIEFLSIEEVLELHLDQIQRYGGEPNVRDLGLLQSAIGMPSAMFSGAYLHEFPHGMAAAYLFHIASNHPFVDGNKRTALAAALMFLALNDLTLGAKSGVVEEMVLAVASGKLDKDGCIAFFKQHVRGEKP